MVQRIALGGRRGAGRFALVDDADAELVANYSWSLHTNGHGGEYVAAYVRGSGRANPRFVLMHQLITGKRHQDHVNGDGLDNTRDNLRDASRSQNGANQNSRGGSSRFKGVHWAKPSWIARITVNGRGIHLGSFSDEVEAAKAYDLAAREMFGEFARLNFP